MMTPEQKLKWVALNVQAEWDDKPLPDVTVDNVDDLYDDEECLQDAKSEIREGEVRTGLTSDSSRHYESDAVAAQMPDGSWVGWTYWHGGGKWGEPEGIDWMDEAYDLNVEEKEVMTTVRTFTKK